MKKYRRIANLFTLAIMIFVLFGCEKFVEIEGPTTSVNSANVYENDVTAASVLTGIYLTMSQTAPASEGLTSISLLAGLSSDELSMYNASGELTLSNYYSNAVPVQAYAGFWNSIYPIVYRINAALEGISNSSSLTPAVKQQLLGEAKFMRAFCFFYLVNFYGDVPLTLGTDFKENSSMIRTPKEVVWKQIITDLMEARSLLSSEYLDANILTITQERVRPTKSVAIALLSRAYLYMKDWQNAEVESSILIENEKFALVDLDEVFKKNNMEAIWQLQPVIKGYNSSDANAFIINAINGLNNSTVYVNDKVLQSFDPGDLRKRQWIKTFSLAGINYPYANKYKVYASTDPGLEVTEYPTIFRLAEQYLIRAEARIRQNKIADGIADLNTVRERATEKTDPIALQLKKLSTTVSMADALTYVEKERQSELFTEWGHRWLDLKRTEKIDVIMKNALPSKVPGRVWESYNQFYPVPLNDLRSNPNLTQNIGY